MYLKGSRKISYATLARWKLVTTYLCSWSCWRKKNHLDLCNVQDNKQGVSCVCAWMEMWDGVLSLATGFHSATMRQQLWWFAQHHDVRLMRWSEVFSFKETALAKSWGWNCPLVLAEMHDEKESWYHQLVRLQWCWGEARQNHDEGGIGMWNVHGRVLMDFTSYGHCVGLRPWLWFISLSKVKQYEWVMLRGKSHWSKSEDPSASIFCSS